MSVEEKPKTYRNHRICQVVGTAEDQQLVKQAAKAAGVSVHAFCYERIMSSVDLWLKEKRRESA